MKEIISKLIKQHPFLKEIDYFSRKFNHEKSPIYLVGGTVRALLLLAERGQEAAAGAKTRGNTFHLSPFAFHSLFNDFDFALKGAAGFASKLSSENGLTLVPLEDSKGKETYRIVSNGVFYDFSEMRGENITEDLMWRDFSINSIAMPLDGFLKGALKSIDPLDGRNDLKNRVVRMNSALGFMEDPLRMLRAYRIAGETGFSIASSTLREIKKNCSLILMSSHERIRYELFKILELKESFRQIYKNPLLNVIFPEIAVLKGFTQNRFHSYDVYRHSFKTYEYVELITANCGVLFPEISEGLKLYLENSKKPLLKLLALLHDIGKPAAKTEDDNGEIHFYKHEKIGAGMADEICRRLKFSNFERNFITKGILYHLRPFNFIGKESRKAVVRFFTSLKDDSVAVLLLTAADNVAKRYGKVSLEQAEKGCLLVKPYLLWYFKEIKPLLELPKLVNGNDLMKRYNLAPSPLIGRILKKIEESQLNKEIKTKAEAMRMAGRILRSNVRFHNKP